MSTMTVTEGPETAVEEVPKKSKRKLLIIVAVLLLLAGGGAYTFLLAPDGEDPEAAPVEGEIVPLEALTTTTGTAAMHHARVAVALVLAEGADPALVTARSALLQDALLREIAAMDADGLRSSAGSDGLRTALTAHAQEVWPDGEVLRVVLTELLVQ